MISFKTITGVIFAAILIGVVYVTFEKNFFGEKAVREVQTSSSQELSNDTLPQKTSLISLPDPESLPTQITESSDLESEASALQMRDYSAYFEQLKDTLKE